MNEGVKIAEQVQEESLERTLPPKAQKLLERMPQAQNYTRQTFLEWAREELGIGHNRAWDWLKLLVEHGLVEVSTQKRPRTCDLKLYQKAALQAPIKEGEVYEIEATTAPHSRRDSKDAKDTEISGQTETPEAQSDVQGGSGLNGNNAGKLPTSKRCSQRATVAVAHKRNLIDEVGEEQVADVKGGWAEVVLPASVGIGNIAQVAGTVTLGE